MPSPTDTPLAPAAPLLAASMMPGPPPDCDRRITRPRPARHRSARPARTRVSPAGSGPSRTPTPRDQASAISPKPSTNSAWMRRTRHGWVRPVGRAAPVEQALVRGRLGNGALPRSMAGPCRRTRRFDSGLTPMAPKVAPTRPADCDQCRRAQDTLITPMMTQIRATSATIPPLAPFETGSIVPATPMPMPIEPSARTTEAALRARRGGHFR